MRGWKILVRIEVVHGRPRLTYRDIQQDTLTRDPIVTNTHWRLASGDGRYGMNVFWPDGGVFESHSWALGMN